MSDREMDYLAAALEPLRRNPSQSAVLTDFDGVLVPIGTHGNTEHLPEATRGFLQEIHVGYRLAAIVTLRRAKSARTEAGFPIHVNGSGGPETIRANEDKVRVKPLYRALGIYSRRFAMKEWENHLRDAGVVIEDNGPLVVFHFHGADDVARAKAAVDVTHNRARRRPLKHTGGSRALGIAPRIRTDKGVAVHETLQRVPGVRCAIYLGDEITDVAAMNALAERVSKGQLDYALRVAVVGPHTPPEVINAANLVVNGPAGAAEVFKLLSQPLSL